MDKIEFIKQLTNFHADARLNAVNFNKCLMKYYDYADIYFDHITWILQTHGISKTKMQIHPVNFDAFTDKYIFGRFSIKSKEYMGYIVCEKKYYNNTYEVTVESDEVPNSFIIKITKLGE